VVEGHECVYQVCCMTLSLHEIDRRDVGNCKNTGGVPIKLWELVPLTQGASLHGQGY